MIPRLVALLVWLHFAGHSVADDSAPQPVGASSAVHEALFFAHAPGSPNGDALTALLGEAGKRKLNEADRVALGDRVVQSFGLGIDLDAMTLAFGKVDVTSARPMYLESLGSNPYRGELYADMLARATSVLDADPDKARRLARAGVVLSFLDFASTPRETWSTCVADPQLHRALGLEPSELERLTAFAEAVRASSSNQMPRLIEMAQHLPAAHTLSDNGLIDPSALARVTKVIEAIWTEGQFGPVSLLASATAAWKLQCLASAQGDSASISTIRGLSDRLQAVAGDAIARRWAAQILTPGPAPKGPAIRRLTPEDVRGSEPR